ncbi:hypothetical protein U1Q18_045905 [Sarracenia purpurea var. burkii]
MTSSPVIPPAGVDFRSPFTSLPEMQSKQQLLTPQNPNPNARFPFVFGACPLNNLPEQVQSLLPDDSETTKGPNVGNASEDGFSCGLSSPIVSRMSSVKSSCSSVSGRSKPRIVKTRRQISIQQGKTASVPAQNGWGLNNFLSVSGKFSQVKNSTSCTSNEFSASIGDVTFGKLNNAGFVFGADKSSSMSNLNSVKKETNGLMPNTDGFVRFSNVGLVFGINNSISDSNPTSEHKDSSEYAGQSGAIDFGKFESVGISYGDNQGSSTSLNLNLENGQCGESIGKSGTDEFVNCDKVGFQFGASLNCPITKSNSVLRQSSESVQQVGADEFGKFSDVSFVFGANKNNLVSNKKSEQRASCENVGQQLHVEELRKSENERRVFDTNRSSVKKPDDKGFVFGAKRGNITPNSKLEKKKSSENVEKLASDASGEMKIDPGKVDDVGFVFGGSGKHESIENGKKSVPIDSHKMKSGADLGKFGKLGFVFGASSPNVSSSISDFQKTKVDIEVELQKTEANDVFMFGCKNSSFSESTELIDEMNKVNRENPEIYPGFLDNCGEKSGSVVNNKENFVFGSMISSTSASGTSTVSKLTDEIRKMTVGGCENTGCPDNTKDPNINCSATFNHVFLFGSNKNVTGSCTGKSGTTSCDHIKNENSQGPGNGGAVEKTEGINIRTTEANTFVFAGSDNAACFFGGAQNVVLNGTIQNTSGLGVLDEQIEVGCPFGSFWEKQPTNVKEMGFDFRSVGISTPKPFSFQAGLVKSSDGPQDQINDDRKLNKISNKFLFSSSELGFEAPSIGRIENKNKFSFTSAPVVVGESTMDCRKPSGDASCSFAANLYPKFNENLEFGDKCRSIRGKRWKKTQEKLRNRQNCVSKEGSQHKSDSPGCYSPMDFSPHQDNSAPSTRNVANSIRQKDEDLAAASEGANINEGEKKCRLPNEEGPENRYERVVASVDEAENKCSDSKSEQDSIKSGGHDAKMRESECTNQFCFVSSAQDKNQKNFTFCASSTQDNFSATKCKNRKKYRMKVGHDPHFTPTNRKVDTTSSPVQSSCLDSSYLRPIGEQDKEGDINSRRKEDNKSIGDEEHDKQGSASATQEACEKWRNRYFFYHSCSFASENLSFPPAQPGCCTNVLRKDEGSPRGLYDGCCTRSWLSQTLGNVEDALQYFSKCLESGTDVCLDRRIVIEAANGLQKAQKVADCMNQCAELLRQRTHNAASSALKKISDVLSISSYSEKLLEMKGEALLMYWLYCCCIYQLRRYKEVIQFCEQTLAFAEKNFLMVAGDNNLVNEDGPKCKKSSVRLWRWHLMSKSYFHFGRLDVALDFLEKQEQLKSTEDK